MEPAGVAFWVGNGELIFSYFFFSDRSLLNGSMAISSRLQAGLLTQITADTSVVGLIRVDSLNINGFPLGQRLDLMRQSLVKQDFHSNLCI